MTTTTITHDDELTARTTKKILVVANATIESSVLRETIGRRVTHAAPAEVLIVAPALNSRLRHWVSDEGEARLAAERRLHRCLDRLAVLEVDAAGTVGDADPLLAISDALHTFPADEIIIATHPEGRSHWLARSLVKRARARFSVQILHIVVDAVRRQEYLVGPVGVELARSRLPAAA